MKIAIIGTGHVGSALGARWASAGHEIIFGSRDPQGDKARSLRASIGGDVLVATVEEAAAAGEVTALKPFWSQPAATMSAAVAASSAPPVTKPK